MRFGGWPLPLQAAQCERTSGLLWVSAGICTRTGGHATARDPARVSQRGRGLGPYFRRMLLHHVLVDVGTPGLVGTIKWPFSMPGSSVTRSSFQGTSLMSISMMRKFGIAAQKWALISVDM
jgi:hypothetical protein